MIVVIDTNVLISGLAKKRSHPRLVLDAAVEGRITLAYSPHLLAEWRRALSYERVQKLVLPSWDAGELDRFLTRLVRLSLLVLDVQPKENWVPNDPDDNWVIQCALTAAADIIVSGDAEVLRVGRIGDLRVLAPAQFMAELDAR